MIIYALSMIAAGIVLKYYERITDKRLSRAEFSLAALLVGAAIAYGGTKPTPPPQPPPDLPDDPIEAALILKAAQNAKGEIRPVGAPLKLNLINTLETNP